MHNPLPPSSLPADSSPYRAQAALVLFSGGQDSTTCLLWAQRRFAHVHAVAFYYGQRHSIELTQAELIARTLGVPLTRLALTLPDLAHNSLTNAALALPTDAIPPLDSTEAAPHAPSTFVPGRNLFFFTAAGALAYSLGITHIVAGVCQTDYSGYPDCREPFVRAAEQALSLAMERPFTIHTPLMHLDKAQTWLLARELGGLDLVVEHSHTCYAGDRITRHAWGYGCGQCAACQLRARGYQQAFN